MKVLDKHLEKMEQALVEYCAAIQPVGRGDMVKEIWTEVAGKRYSGGFDPDVDYFAYLILRQWGRLVDVLIMNYSVERNFDQKVRYIASFIGKYVEVNSQVKKVIEQYSSLKGLHRERWLAVVVWWRAP